MDGAVTPRDLFIMPQNASNNSPDPAQRGDRIMSSFIRERVFSSYDDSGAAPRNPTPFHFGAAQLATVGRPHAILVLNGG
jgi:hypothetical protein